MVWSLQSSVSFKYLSSGSTPTGARAALNLATLHFCIYTQNGKQDISVGDHAVLYIVCGCPSLVFSKLSPAALALRCLTFLISLEADLQGSTDPFANRHDYVRAITTKRDIGHHRLHC